MPVPQLPSSPTRAKNLRIDWSAAPRSARFVLWLSIIAIIVVIGLTLAHWVPPHTTVFDIFFLAILIVTLPIIYTIATLIVKVYIGFSGR